MASAHDYSFRRLSGGDDIALGDYAGKALLIVNVASACGYTPQYRELEHLWGAKRVRGLIVIGVPSNDFGAQERGLEGEIKAFCESNYGVSFPMTGKVEIVGPNRHPFYRWIEAELGEGGMPRWNFHKYLIGPDGALAGSFASSVAPLGPQLLSAIERTLAHPTMDRG